MARSRTVALALLACILAALALSAPAGATTVGATASWDQLTPPGKVHSGGAGFRSGPRIVGGNATNVAKYPWQVQLEIETIAGTFICGGSLITPRIVLTAAHCRYDEEGNAEPAVILAWTGRTNLESGGLATLATATQAAPGYNPVANFPQSNRNDAALVLLATPVSAPLIQLAGPTELALWSPNRTTFVTGWGDTSEGGDLSPVLKEAAVPIVADSTCAEPAHYGVTFDPATMVCAGPLAGGTDSCQGDSGGPLQSPIDGGGFRLVGVVSWGEGCAQPNKPGVYSRIGADPLQAFVRNTVAGVEPSVSVIGSGARPLGCAQSEAELAAVGGLLPAAQAVLAGATKKQRSTTKALKAARRRAKAARRSGVGIKAAVKRLKKASRKAKAAKRGVVSANQGLATANTTFAAAAAKAAVACN